jgi:DNA invertase Pin-like site-specific DNA recombinase
MNYGYARVSAAGQDYARQVERLQAAGCARIFSEKASAAAGRKRPALRQAVAALGAGDCLIVTDLSRLGRSVREALNTLAAVADRRADFRSLGEAWADTTTPHGALFVTVALGFAEFDRAAIAERTADGRQAAKARGVRMGRRPTLNPTQRAYVRAQRQAQPPASIGDLQKLLGVSRSTIVRASREPAPAAGQVAEAVPWHAPTCAIFGSGAGAGVRCTCGGVAHGARGLQVDVEEFTGG